MKRCLKIPRTPDLEKYQQIKNMIESGHSHRKIQRFLNCSPNTIQNAMRYYNMNNNNNNDRITTKTYQQINKIDESLLKHMQISYLKIRYIHSVIFGTDKKKTKEQMLRDIALWAEFQE